MKKLIFLLCVSILAMSAEAQFTRYIIRLKNKSFNTYSVLSPAAFLSQRAIERRTRYNIPVDSTDLPVTQRYLDSIRLSGNVTILNTSKWLNQVAIKTSDAAALARINSFSFVISATPIAPLVSTNNPVNKELDGPPPAILAPAGPLPQQLLSDYYGYGRSNGQVKIHAGEFLHNLGFRGEGMQLAMLDAGFYHYQTLPTFDSLRLNNQVLGTWDFVNNEASVDEDYYHGMLCLSTIVANLPGVFVGTAPKTSVYLFRTEDVNTEYPVEEQNYAAGLERADSAGVDMVSTSLGYSEFDNSLFNYTYADMNGDRTISSRAADYAARKGMLLLVANGNEGTHAWHYLTTPADADSVLAVGAVDTLGNVAAFSSYGPGSDGQVKPGVASVGYNAVVANTNTGQPAYNNGTSLACPNLAGIATCLWQAFPEVNNMSVITALELSATRASNPDTRVGYGIPNARKAFAILAKQVYRSTPSINNCMADISFDAKNGNGFDLILQRKLTGENNFTAVDTFPGQGGFTVKHFQYSDNLANAPTGNVQYRLQMRVLSDTSFYLDTMQLNYTTPCIPANNDLRLSPNPVSSILRIEIARNTAADVVIRIHNSAGQQVYEKQQHLDPGTYITEADMRAKPHGIYFVSIYADGRKTITRKILR